MMDRRTLLAGGLSGLALAGCTPGRSVDAAGGLGVEIRDSAARRVLHPGMRPQVLSSGYIWSEGPAWDERRQCLYFTDVPGNTAYRWSEPTGTQVWQQPSGIAAQEAVGMREAGLNGLWCNAQGELWGCNHGRRRVERIDPETGERTALVERFDGQAFNSPNDLAISSAGAIYFTDPPYGLEGLDASPLKEMSVNGVYRLDPDGHCVRLIDDMTFPNGIGLSPDERWLYVAQSDPDAPVIRRFRLDAEGGVSGGEVWVDARDALAAGEQGLPDGMSVLPNGWVFATAPGGVSLLSEAGDVLARIRTASATANCTLGEDGGALFITAHDRLLRLELRREGVR
ncbi:SMP-30/gluconolactonase/LRE family protein [Maricaulis sp. D1M11]